MDNRPQASLLDDVEKAKRAVEASESVVIEKAETILCEEADELADRLVAAQMLLEMLGYRILGLSALWIPGQPGHPIRLSRAAVQACHRASAAIGMNMLPGKSQEAGLRSRAYFAYLERDADADLYQGHSYTRVYIEEAGNFPNPAPVLKLMATLRSGAGVPVGLRATGNPGGPGHHPSEIGSSAIH